MDNEQPNTKPTKRNTRPVLPKPAAIEVLSLALLDAKAAGINVRFGQREGVLVINIPGVFYDRDNNVFKLLPEGTWQQKDQ